MLTIDLEAAARLLPPRAHDAHKGSFGHALIIAGSRGYAGAAQLCASGALRSGAGLVTLAVPRDLQDGTAAALPEAITAGLPCTAAGVFRAAAVREAVSLAQGKSAVICGPGLSQDDEAIRFVDGFLRLGVETPLVLDADALNAVGVLGGPSELGGAGHPVVITPHPGEAARLLERATAQVQDDRESAALELAATSGCITVLKGFATLVATPQGRIAVNTSGGHGLSKGGSGDVLAGLLTGLLAQGMDTFDASCLAVYVHGLAGEIAQGEHSARGMLAGDLLSAMGAAWLQVEAAA